MGKGLTEMAGSRRMYVSGNPWVRDDGRRRRDRVVSEVLTPRDGETVIVTFAKTDLCAILEKQ